MSKTFDEMTQPDSSVLLVVDGINLAFKISGGLVE